MFRLSRADSPISLSIECYNAICTKIITLNLNENINLLSPGEHQKYLYWVKSGVVRSYSKVSGGMWTNWFAAEGQAVCAMESFFYKKPSMGFIETCSPVTLYRIKRSDCFSLLKDYPELYKFAFQHAQDNLMRSETRRYDIHLLTAYQRYEKFLETHSFIANRVKMSHIASYLGVTPTHLSRIRSDIAKKRKL